MSPKKKRLRKIQVEIASLREQEAELQRSGTGRIAAYMRNTDVPSMITEADARISYTEDDL